MGSLTPHLVLAPDAALDLQIHTTASDGRWTTEQVVDHLVREGFGLAAITDHDRVDTVAALQQLAAEKQLPLLAAVEMSASWNGAATDVLCYGVEPGQNALHALAQEVLRRQQENTRMVYEHLCQTGYIDPRGRAESPHYEQQRHSDELQAILAQPSAQQPHELVALLQRHGYGRAEPPVGKILDDAGLQLATIDLAAIVDAAHRSGAVCLIAHPGRGGFFLSYDVPLLDRLRHEVPIDGLEVYYPAHTPEQVAMYLDYAQKHRLLLSAGSDSHGPERPPIKYQAALCRDLLERVGIVVR